MQQQIHKQHTLQTTTIHYTHTRVKYNKNSNSLCHPNCTIPLLCLCVVLGIIFCGICGVFVHRLQLQTPWAGLPWCQSFFSVMSHVISQYSKKAQSSWFESGRRKNKTKPKAATANSDSGLHLQVKASRRSDDLISKLASGTNGQNDLLLHVCFCCSSGKSPANRPPGPVGRGAKRRRRLPPAHGEFAATGSQNGKTLCVKK